MIEREIVVTTNHGSMPSFAVHPEGSGPWPGILFYMDAPGIRPELYNMARRIARRGYYVLLPDLYYRLGTMRFDLTRRDESMSKVISACIAHSRNSTQITYDTAAMLAHLDAQAEVRPGDVGAIGYCGGGMYITWAAARFPHRIAAAASLYGVRLVNPEPDSPHLEVGNVRGELYFGFAEHDKASAPEIIEGLTKALKESSVQHEIEILPGTEHGFCFPERRQYATQAAEHCWRKVFDLFERNLRSAGQHSSESES